MTTDNALLSDNSPSSIVDLAPPASSAIQALNTLADAARGFAVDAKAPSTRKAYQSDWHSFSTWCQSMGLVAMPAPAKVVATYVTHMAVDLHRKVATIQRSLVSISQAHRMAGHRSPTSEAIVLETMKGIRRSIGAAQIQKAPALPEQLRAMLSATGDDLLSLRNRALLLLGFCGGFRRSELVGLNVVDVDFTVDGLVVTLRRSKTDQESLGRKVGVPYGAAPNTCPVRSLRAWLDAAGMAEGPVFRPVGRWGRVGEGRLDDRAVSRVVKAYAAGIGLDASRYAGHSLRAGLATAAARAGKSERAIMAQTGHRSIAMVRKYIREGSLFAENAAAGLL